MENQKKPNASIVCISVEPGKYSGLDYGAFLQQAENQFQGFEKHFIKFCPGVYLVDPVECHPALVKLADCCNSEKLLVVRLIVAELGEALEVLSPEYQAVQAFLRSKHLTVKKTK